MSKVTKDQLNYAYTLEDINMLIDVTHITTLHGLHILYSECLLKIDRWPLFFVSVPTAVHTFEGLVGLSKKESKTVIY